MGQPAAALGDVAAHGGTIAIGSPNVFIGGRPAARQGDSITCPLHGTGVIGKGSATVFINGMPAARLLDMTGCMTAMTPKTAPPIIYHNSLASDNEQNLSDFEAKGGEIDAYFEHAQTDSNNDGILDTHDVSLGLLRSKSVQSPLTVKVSDHEIAEIGEAEFSMANIAGKYSLSQSETSLNSEQNIEGHIYKGTTNVTIIDTDKNGQQNARLKVGASGQFLHGEIKNREFIGSDNVKTGVIIGVGAAAEVLKQEVLVDVTKRIGDYEIQYIEKGSFSEGSIGGAYGLQLYKEHETGRIHIGADAALKIALGLESEFELVIGKIPGISPSGVPGTIAIGNPTVLIG